jgi:hypothetical protein
VEFSFNVSYSTILIKYPFLVPWEAHHRVAYRPNFLLFVDLVKEKIMVDTQ